jgi:PAS domain S-box-containing protein
MSAGKRRTDLTDRDRAHGSLASRVNELAALYEFTERLFRTKSQADIYDAGMDAVRTALGCTRVAILLFDEHGVMRFVAWRGLSEEYRDTVTGHSPWDAGETEPGPVCIGHVKRADLPAALKTVLRREGIGALAFIPLLAHGKLTGKFMTYYDRPRAFADAEIDLALTIARQLGFAIERSRAEDALRGREAALEDIFNRTPFMLTRCNRAYKFLFVSRAYAEMLGLPPEAIIGKPIRDIIGDEAFNMILPNVERVLRGERVEYEHAIPLRTIGTRVLRGIYTPQMDDKGVVQSWLGSLLDITERKQAELRLAALNERLEAEVETRTRERDRVWNVSEDLLGVSTFAGNFVSINPAWTKTLGWNEAEIKSLHVNDLRHPDDAALSLAARDQLARGGPTVRIENRFRHKDGSWRWIAWTMTADEGLIYLAGRHVTAQKEAAAALERAHQQLANAQKMEALGQLTGGVAHDFNNLLMIVGGYAQSLKRRLVDAKDVRALDAIESAVSRGESLTRQLLAFSRRQPLDPVVFHPAEAVDAIRDVLSGSTRAHIDLSIDIANNTWPIRVDRSEFALALVNIAINARDSMPDGGRLSIASENVTLQSGDVPDGLSGDHVALCIADTGCGIAADVLPRVFEPFFTTKEVHKGTGLGLSQVYGFARRSGGTVIIASELQRGTTVTVYLPRSHGRLPAPPAGQSAEHQRGKQETILVVEDNGDVRSVAVSLLAELGYRTVEAETAAAGVDMLERGHVDLVFTDVVLPGAMDGLALAQKITAQRPELPVVLTTGYARSLDGDPGYAVLRKPYDISSLGRVIRSAIDAKSGREAGARGQSTAANPSFAR